METPGTHKVMFQLVRKYVPAEQWNAGPQAIQRIVSDWMKKMTGGGLLDISVPSKHLEFENFQMIARVSSSLVHKALKCSGAQGIFTRPYYEAGTVQQDYKVVPLPMEADLASGLRTANSHAVAVGLVTTRSGLALRVPTAEFETTVKLIHPTEPSRFLDQRWEVAGVPLDWGPEALQAFLGAWDVKIIHQRRV